MSSGTHETAGRQITRKQAEENAHAIVEALLETSVSRDFFLSSVKQLTSRHYEDVTIERSLSKLCGFCLCDRNLLSPFSTGTHKIFRNRVYDITARKRFCSNRCYAISCHVMKQISPVPLYLRVNVKLPDIDISDVPSKVGEEICMRHQITKSEVSSLDDAGHQMLNSPYEMSQELLSGQASDDETKTSTLIKNTTNLENSEKDMCNRMTQADQSNPSQPVSVLDEMRGILSQWISRETVDLLFEQGTRDCGTGILVSHVEKSPRQELETNLSSIGMTSSCTVTANSFEGQQDIIDDVSNYRTLVSQFLGLTTSVPEYALDEAQSGGPDPVRISQKREIRQFQEKLILDKVKMCLDGFSVPVANISSGLRLLVKTFNITRFTVMVRAEVWPVLTLSLLFLLSMNNTMLKSNMDKDEFREASRLVLKVHGCDFLSLKNELSDILSSFKMIG